MPYLSFPYRPQIFKTSPVQLNCASSSLIWCVLVETNSNNEPDEVNAVCARHFVRTGIRAQRGTYPRRHETAEPFASKTNIRGKRAGRTAHRKAVRLRTLAPS